MVELQSATRRFYRRTLLTCLGLAFVTTAIGPAPAFAHHRHAHRGRIMMAHRVFGQVRPAHVRPGSYTPAFSVYAVDGNSGRALYGRDENALRHPASITKVMTLYLLFEQLEKGRLSLDSRMEVSAHAASQAPTKLGLRPGSTIRVEDAIKSIVTKSANDMAVTVAETIGGDERTFAAMMTRKAHSLGMSRSNFVNASGLPDEMQLTTAHDLVILGRAIHDHYPRYFRFFSTPSFTYAGQFMPNHNHLMEQVEGMDGIKTGYTRMSGFNLLSSVSRDGHWLVSVVLGGKTRLGRDRIMADLIASEIDKCATTRTAPMIAENPDLEHVAEAIPVIQHEGDAAPPVEGVDDEAAEQKQPAIEADQLRPAQGPATSSEEAAEGEEPIQAPSTPTKPTLAKPTLAKPLPAKLLPAKVAVIETKRPRPAFVSNIPRPPERDMTATGSINRREARLDGSTSRYTGAATATPASKRGKREAAQEKAHEKVEAKPIRVASLDPDIGATGRPTNAHGWMIQIGATDTIAKANDLINRAKGEDRRFLANARPFTEKVQKGKETLYRARFTGLEADAAGSACKTLKRAGFSCFATKN